MFVWSLLNVIRHPLEVGSNVGHFLLMTDVFLVGMMMLVAAIGLYELFIRPVSDKPARRPPAPPPYNDGPEGHGCPAGPNACPDRGGELRRRRCRGQGRARRPAPRRWSHDSYRGAYGILGVRHGPPPELLTSAAQRVIRAVRGDSRFAAGAEPPSGPRFPTQRILDRIPGDPLLHGHEKVSLAVDTRETPLWSTVVRRDRTKPTSVRKVPPTDPVGQGSAAGLVVTCCGASAAGGARKRG